MFNNSIDWSALDSLRTQVIQPICDEPRIIVNPLVIDFILKNHSYVLRGKKMSWIGRKSDIDRLKFILSPKRNGITLDDGLLDSFAISTDGEVVPVYQLVPCGHCPNCILSKRFSFVERCKLESQLYSSLPWFVTLTYDDNHLPYVSSECYDDVGNIIYIPRPSLNVRDVQLFLKRFRSNLKRKYDGKYDAPIRYAVCGEYGKNTHRPHYHMIIWNLPSSTATDYVNISNLISKSWSKGFITRRLIDPSNDKCFKYTTKYMCKSFKEDGRVSQFQKKPFINSSRRNGGIGRPFVDGFRDYVNRTFDTNLKYYDRFTGSTKDVKFNKWSLDCLFPTFSRLVPSDVRRAVIEMSYFQYLRDGYCPFNRYDYPYQRVFSKHMYVPDFCYGETLTDLHFSGVDECHCVVQRWLRKLDIISPQNLDDTLSNFKRLHSYRDKFLIAYMSQQSDINLNYRSYIGKKDIDRSISLEIL